MPDKKVTPEKNVKELQKSYTELNSELRSVLESLENGSLDIDQAASQYKAGLTIIIELEARLKSAENTVNALRASHDERSVDVA